MSTIFDLPNDCVKDILQFTTVKDMINFIKTCKQFFGMLDFVKQQSKLRKTKLYDSIGVMKELKKLEGKNLQDIKMLVMKREISIHILQELPQKDLIKLWDHDKIPSDPLTTLLRSILDFDASHIQHLQNPSLEFQLMVIRDNIDFIKYIENPFLEVQLEAVRQNGRAIQYIENASHEVQLEAVKNNATSIQFIENASLEVQHAAVKKDMKAVYYIKHPSLEIQMYVVQKDMRYCFYIKKPHESVLLYLYTNMEKDDVVSMYLRLHREALLKLF